MHAYAGLPVKISISSSSGHYTEAECEPGESHADCFRRHLSRPAVLPTVTPGAESDDAPKGPGWHLKKLLRSFGIVATANCSCNARARTMDANGCDWCEANLDEIVGWLREEAAKRGLPFIDVAGRVLVRRAIANARKEAARARGSQDHD